MLSWLGVLLVPPALVYSIDNLFYSVQGWLGWRKIKHNHATTLWRYRSMIAFMIMLIFMMLLAYVQNGIKLALGWAMLLLIWKAILQVVTIMQMKLPALPFHKPHKRVMFYLAGVILMGFVLGLL